MNVEFVNYDNSLVNIGQIRTSENNQIVLITDCEKEDSVGYNAVNLTGEDTFKLYFTEPQMPHRIINEFPTLLNSAGIKVLIRND